MNNTEVLHCAVNTKTGRLAFLRLPGLKLRPKKPFFLRQHRPQSLALLFSLFWGQSGWSRINVSFWKLSLETFETPLRNSRGLPWLRLHWIFPFQKPKGSRKRRKRVSSNAQRKTRSFELVADRNEKNGSIIKKMNTKLSMRYYSQLRNCTQHRKWKKIFSFFSLSLCHSPLFPQYSEKNFLATCGRKPTEASWSCSPRGVTSQTYGAETCPTMGSPFCCTFIPARHHLPSHTCQLCYFSRGDHQ